MTTAREKLYEEVTALLARPIDDASDPEIRRIMVRYRVQTKPGIEIPPNRTARDALGDRILDLWRVNAPDVKAKMGVTIDEFRMQMKGQGGGAPKPQRPRPASGGLAPGGAPGLRPADDDDDDGPMDMDESPRPASSPADRHAGATANPAARKPLAPPRPALSPAGLPNPGARPQQDGLSVPLGADALRGRGGRPSAEPVAGGPRKRGRSRGECPKCHSMGVVLARSYAGDEYYSCIYCGWQAYKPTDEDDPNASLAVRLLGQTVGES